MKYILLRYHTEGVFTSEDLPEAMPYSIGLYEKLAAKGQFVGTSLLQKISTATSLMSRSGRTEVRDGPFVKTKEQLGGYVIVDILDLDDAIAIAEKFPAAQQGTVEIAVFVGWNSGRKSRLGTHAHAHAQKAWAWRSFVAWC